MLTEQIERKLNGNCTRMLRVILNKSWKQRLTNQKLYSHLPPISKTIEIKRTRYVGHCWRSKTEVTISDGPFHMNVPVLANQQELTYNSSAQTQDTVWKTRRKLWMIGTNGERESGKFIQTARLDNDEISIIILWSSWFRRAQFLSVYHNIKIYPHAGNHIWVESWVFNRFWFYTWKILRYGSAISCIKYHENFMD